MQDLGIQGTHYIHRLRVLIPPVLLEINSTHCTDMQATLTY